MPTEEIPTLETQLQRVDRILVLMQRSHGHMDDLRAYIERQDALSRDLYLWDTYPHYRRLTRSARILNEAVQDLREALNANGRINIPARVASTFVRFAAGKSISVSESALFVISTMNRKALTCFEEVDLSTMSAENKDIAKARIVQELNKINRNTTMLTDSTFTALDLLVAALYGLPAAEHLPQNEPLPRGTEVAKARRARNLGMPQAFLWIVLVVALATGVTYHNALLQEQKEQMTRMTQLRETVKLQGEMLREVMEGLQNLQRESESNMTTLTANFDKSNSHFTELHMADENLGHRLDTLWEALGPPNEDGTYFKTPKGEAEEDSEIADLPKLRDKLAAQRERFRKEIVDLRRYVNLMDLRLTKKVERLERKRF